MVKRIAVLVVVVFFALGTFTAMAGGDKAARHDKGALQCAYNWFAGLGKACCCACGKACCEGCKADCGGKCCSECGKK